MIQVNSTQMKKLLDLLREEGILDNEMVANLNTRKKELIISQFNVEKAHVHEMFKDCSKKPSIGKKEKCRNFLANLLVLSRKEQKSVEISVRNLIQKLISGQVEPEKFCDMLESLLNASPQPSLIGFLKESVPLLRQSLVTKELTLEGINPPAPHVAFSTISAHTRPILTRTNVQMNPPTSQKEKCRNFLANLLDLVKKDQNSVEISVQNLIQKLISGQVEPEKFCDILESLLNASAQPGLIGFLKESLPLLRQSLVTKELTLEGINPPAPHVAFSTISAHTRPILTGTNVQLESVPLHRQSLVTKQLTLEGINPPAPHVEFPTIPEPAQSILNDTQINEDLDTIKKELPEESLMEDCGLQSEKEVFSDDYDIKAEIVREVRDPLSVEDDNLFELETDNESAGSDTRENRKGGKRKSNELLSQDEKIKTTLALQKERALQRREELRLRAIEVKQKGEELRLREMELSKANYLTNLEKEKLKCLKEISASLRKFSKHRTGNIRFHNILYKGLL